MLDSQDVPGEGEVGIVVVEDDTGEPWCDVRSELAGRRELSRGVLEVEQLPPAEALLEDLLRRQCRTGVVLYPAVHEGDVVEPARVPTCLTHGPVNSSTFRSSLLRVRMPFFSRASGTSKFWYVSEG